MFDPNYSLDDTPFSAQEIDTARLVARAMDQHDVFTFNFQNVNVNRALEAVERNLERVGVGKIAILCPNRREEDFRQRNGWPSGLYVPDTPNVWKRFSAELENFVELLAIPDRRRFSAAQLTQISKAAPKHVVFAIQDKDEPDNVVRPASDLNTALDPEGEILAPRTSAPTP